MEKLESEGAAAFRSVDDREVSSARNGWRLHMHASALAGRDPVIALREKQPRFVLARLMADGPNRTEGGAIPTAVAWLLRRLSACGRAGTVRRMRSRGP